MNKNSIGIIIVLLAIAGGWYWFSKFPIEEPVDTQSPAVGTTETGTVPAGVTVAYTDQGFSPTEVTVPIGATVTFVNQSSEDMWVASAMHPAHAAYSGTSLSEHCPDTTNTAFDECAAVAAGGSYSFTFNKEGNWKYHNHTNPSRYGSVTVTAN